ncbi:sensor histidine kinase [Streptomyces sp. ISL-43]|uniref:sensor histidine kinase n=1 Tax=Streptomyces sp. ISL-43 TaxID=2819183 RepID=UPI001BED0A76|nr:histidine kinase [Streptomyces sp. ISL-43]MBT2449591.1 sensor histidine kinase [Streptomyces sp. ISL-43]
MAGEDWLFGAVCGAVAGAAVLVACGLAVALVRAKRAHRAAIEERGWLLERERETAARTAVDAERARIAAELHDIVSHNVSLMVVQAGAAREVLATMPQEAAAAMSAVEKAGRTTMTELRHLLGLLAPAQDGTDEPYGGAPEAELSPQPSLSRLSPLIDRIAFAGLPVEVRISGEPRPLPAGIDVTAYRIIQEALTNALKHGDGVKAEVTVRYADHALRVEVLNSGPSVLSAGDRTPATATADTPGISETTGVTGTAGTAGATGTPAGPAAPAAKADGAGRGLVGLRERVAVYGGDFDARRRLGGGYRVRARLPLERP